MTEAVLIDLPNKVRGFCVRTYDDGEEFYRIFINAHLSDEQQKKTYLHEVAHIESGDFDCGLPVGLIEGVRHDSGTGQEPL